MRVIEWKTHKRNESEYKMPTARGSIGLPWYSLKGMSKSMYVKTRKMTIYAWVGWSQEKFWWRIEQILTCKLFCELEYRGEKPIESSSSWFLLKFLFRLSWEKIAIQTLASSKSRATPSNCGDILKFHLPSQNRKELMARLMTWVR